MRWYLVVVLSLMASMLARSQWQISVSTSKTSYAYGETIVVSLRLGNAGTVPDTLFSTSTCVARISPDNVNYSMACGELEQHIPFNPGDSRTWYWHLIPSQFGYPSFSGHHRVWGFCAGVDDSADFDAPEYRGGQIYLSFYPAVSQMVVDSIRTAVNGSVTFRFLGTSGISENWTIVGYPVDSLADALSRDQRVKTVEVQRWLSPDSLTVAGVSLQPRIPFEFTLRQNYPNPFNPSTTISYTLARRTEVRVRVYNILGQFVADVTQGMQEGGEHSILFDASFLSSGVYIYTLWTPQFVASKKLVLIK